MSPALFARRITVLLTVFFLLDGKSRAGTDDTTEEITKTIYYSSIYKILSSYYSLRQRFRNTNRKAEKEKGKEPFKMAADSGCVVSSKFGRQESGSDWKREVWPIAGLTPTCCGRSWMKQAGSGNTIKNHGARQFVTRLFIAYSSAATARARCSFV